MELDIKELCSTEKKRAKEHGFLNCSLKLKLIQLIKDRADELKVSRSTLVGWYLTDAYIRDIKSTDGTILEKMMGAGDE